MVDYYSELGLNRNDALEELKRALSQLESTWRRRELTSPEKATATLAMIVQAREVFASEEARKAYDEELDESKAPPAETNAEQEQRLLRQKWKDQAWSYYEIRQFDLAQVAIEKAISMGDENDPDFWKVAAQIYCANEDGSKAMDYCNRAIILSAQPGDATELYIVKAQAAGLQYKTAQGHGASEAELDSLFKRVTEATDKAVDMAQRSGNDRLAAAAVGVKALNLSYLGLPLMGIVKQLANQAISMGDTSGNPEKALDHLQRLLTEKDAEYSGARQLAEAFYDGCRTNSGDADEDNLRHLQYLNENGRAVQQTREAFRELAGRHPEDWEAFFSYKLFESMSCGYEKLQESVLSLRDAVPRAVKLAAGYTTDEDYIDDALNGIEVRLSYYILYFFYPRFVEYEDEVWENETERFARETSDRYMPNREIDRFADSLKTSIKRYLGNCELALTMAECAYVDAIDATGIEAPTVVDRKLKMWKEQINNSDLFLHDPSSATERMYASDNAKEFYRSTLERYQQRVDSYARSNTADTGSPTRNADAGGGGQTAASPAWQGSREPVGTASAKPAVKLEDSKLAASLRQLELSKPQKAFAVLAACSAFCLLLCFNFSTFLYSILSLAGAGLLLWACLKKETFPCVFISVALSVFALRYLLIDIQRVIGVLKYTITFFIVLNRVTLYALVVLFWVETFQKEKPSLLRNGIMMGLLTYLTLYELTQIVQGGSFRSFMLSLGKFLFLAVLSAYVYKYNKDARGSQPAPGQR